MPGANTGDATKRAPPISLPRLEVGDVEGAKRELEQTGVCIFRSVLTEQDLVDGETLFWKHVERSATELKIKRRDRRTHRDSAWKHLGFKKSGVLTQYSVGQSEFLWFVRSRPAVRRCFETVWGTNDLVTSFDGCGAARNPFFADEDLRPLPNLEGSCASLLDLQLEKHKDEQQEPPREGGAVGGAEVTKAGEESKEEEESAKNDFWVDIGRLTQGGWYHLDQNWHITPGFDLYQGLVNFFPANAHSSSTVVVPGSHKRFQKIFRDQHRCTAKRMSHFTLLNKSGDDKYWSGARQVLLEAGDMLLWDSRVIHCNQGIAKNRPPCDVMPTREDQALARLVAYVCMIPRFRLTKEESQLRQKFVQEGWTGTHMPKVVEVKTRTGTKRAVAPKYKPPARKEKAIWSLV